MTPSPVAFCSSDTRLDDGFAWAKKQALAYAFDGDPVGPWYEAALPGRAAFCMRDVSHQAAGAQVLGLRRHNANMLRKFAASISEKRDWCGYWEIDKLDRPAPVDYADDDDFWYNLPGGFDVIDACYRMFLWTGDRAYLEDPVFAGYYKKTLNEFVKRWDRDGDGLVEGNPDGCRRGIGSYNEEVALSVAVDLVIRQHTADLAYAEMRELAGDHLGAFEYRRRAEEIAHVYRTKWWDAATGSHVIGFSRDGKALPGPRCLREFLLAGEIPSQSALEELKAPSYENVEELSYIPEILYRHGLIEQGFAALLRILDPTLPRREYPEVSFAAVGAIAEGLMGIAPDARANCVVTCPGLPRSVEWAEISRVPVFGNEVCVRHESPGKSVFENVAGPAITWRAGFAANVDRITVNGRPAQEKARKAVDAGGRVCSSVAIVVQPGARATAEVR